MYLEVFVHIAHIDELFKGKAINCKINYASQYDMRLLINPKKYKIIESKGSNNMITIRKKKLLERLWFNKNKK